MRATVMHAEDDALMPSRLTLSDVLGTGHHAAVTAKVANGKSVGVIGDGAVGLCGVIAAKRLGAEQVIMMGRHPDRIALAEEFGATDVVSERGEEAVERVHELTGGFGAHSALECVGLKQSTATAISIARPGGAVGRVGVPQDEALPGSQTVFYANVMVGGGPAPCAHTSSSCCPMSSRAASSRPRSSIAQLISTASRTATGRSPTVSRSMSWCSRERLDAGP